tara:strand:+ start:10826 stop:10984 length:159 start_codon:yes stop_codon:yes gene_type:complete
MGDRRRILSENKEGPDYPGLVAVRGCYALSDNAIAILYICWFCSSVGNSPLM